MTRRLRFTKMQGLGNDFVVLDGVRGNSWEEGLAYLLEHHDHVAAYVKNERLGFTIPYEDSDGAYQRYSGDTCVPGKGEILVWKPLA